MAALSNRGAIANNIWSFAGDEDRADVEIKLQKAELCPSCESALAAAGIPMDRLRRLLEVIRTLAVPATVVH
jgi:hypothetical protein